MKIIYLYNNRSYHAFYHAEIEAWLEEKAFSTQENKMVNSYRMIDTVSIFISKGMERFESAKFSFDVGKDGCHGHYSKTRKAFLKDKTDGSASWNQFAVINKRYYERIRSAFIRLGFRHYEMNFERFVGKQKYGMRLLDKL